MPETPPPHSPRGVGGEAPGPRSFSAAGAPKPPSKGASGEAAVCALRMEDLTVWAVERAAKFPRDHKFTVGDKWVETCLDVTTLLTEASFVRDKLPLLAQASRALTRARVLCRIAQRLKLLTPAQREHFSDHSPSLRGDWLRGVAAIQLSPSTLPELPPA